MHHRSLALSQWFIRFLLNIRAKFYIPDNALNLLIKFIYAFITIISNLAPNIKYLVKELPSTLYTMRKKISLATSFKKFTVCTKCLQIYDYDQCIDRTILASRSKQCSYIKYPNHPYLSNRQPCANILLKSVEFASGNTILYPFMIYCYISLKDRLQSLLSNDEFYSNCQLWKDRNSDNLLNTIYDGCMWNTFYSSFCVDLSLLTFALNVDWFQPYTHTNSSVGVIYMTVLNLPRHLRYKRENIILIGIIPGPHEPKYTINSFLKPLVDELLQLWTGVDFYINTPSGKRNKMIKAAIMCVTCDIPAGRKTCGFLGHSATLGCSKCHKEFPGSVGQKDYSGFDRSGWKKRTNEDHRKDVNKIKKICTKTEQEEAESKYGCRYSCLLELPYFDAPRMLCIDIMHNLFLGTGKHMISVWVKQQWLTKNHLESVQQFIDKIHLPSDVGRIPLKIASGFAGFTADQFKTWITIYSIPALFTILPIEQLECWRHFVLACRILCKQGLSRDDINLANCLLMRFCNKVEILYGKEVITPNMHLHGHIKEMLLDYGPSQELWLFSFERYNGFLGKQPTNNRAIEPQLMRRFYKITLQYHYLIHNYSRMSWQNLILLIKLSDQLMKH